MAVQLNPYAGQIQSAVANPFQQRDDSSKAAQREAPSTGAEETSSSAEKSESRTSERSESQQSGGETRSASQRGNNLDVTV